MSDPRENKNTISESKNRLYWFMLELPSDYGAILRIHFNQLFYKEKTLYTPFIPASEQHKIFFSILIERPSYHAWSPNYIYLVLRLNEAGEGVRSGCTCYLGLDDKRP